MTDDALVGLLYCSGSHVTAPPVCRQVLVDFCDDIVEQQKKTAQQYQDNDEIREMALKNIMSYSANAAYLRLSLVDELEVEMSAELVGSGHV